MGFFDTLFGGPTKQQIVSDDQLWLNNQLSQILKSQLGQGGPVYGGQVIPGATQNQLSAFNAGAGLLGSAPGMVDTRGALQSALSGQPSYQIDPAAREAYYKQSIEAPAQREFQDTLRGLEHRYGARFGQAGSLQRASTNAAADLATNLGAARGALLYGDEQARRQALESAANRQTQAVGLGTAGNVAENQMRLANLQGLLGLGGEQRSIEAQQAGEGFQKWQMGQPAFNPWLGYMGQALSFQPYAIGQKPGILGSALGGAVTGGMAAGPWGALGGGLLGAGVGFGQQQAYS